MSHYMQQVVYFVGRELFILAVLLLAENVTQQANLQFQFQALAGSANRTTLIYAKHFHLYDNLYYPTYFYFFLNIDTEVDYRADANKNPCCCVAIVDI